MSLNMSNIKSEVADLIKTVSGVVNVYERKIAYVDGKDFIEKFTYEQIGNTRKYKGFQVYRSARRVDFGGFNKKIFTHTININGIIGIKEEDPEYTYDILEGLLEEIQTTLAKNLTLNGLVTDSEFPVLGDIGMEAKVGRVFWSGDVSWDIIEHVIFTESIS